MKVLMLAGYIYKKGLAGFEKNKTGFGIMVRGIAESVAAAGNEVSLLTGVFTEEKNEGFRILRRTKWDLLRYFDLRDLLRILPELLSARLSLKTVLYQLYHQAGLGLIRHTIRKEKPDVVHIHGMGFASFSKIRLCQKLGVPFVVTAHGLLENDPDAAAFEKKWEQKLFRLSQEESFPVSVISSGILRRLTEPYYGLTSTEHVRVITNGISVTKREKSFSVHEKLGIPQDARILLGVGFVGERKNQIQILRSFALLPDSVRASTHVVLAGVIAEGYPIREEAERLGIADRVHVLGFVEEQLLPSYYQAASLVILASKDEGFGLSLAEGYVYGKPCITFADVDAAEDIYAPFATLLCQTRSDEAFSHTMGEALERQWDADAISAFAVEFSLEKMAEKYVSFYQNTFLK